MTRRSLLITALLSLAAFTMAPFTQALEFPGREPGRVAGRWLED